MTIDEAIKLIQADVDNENVEWNSPLGEAYKLSFEALDYIQRERQGNPGVAYTILNGETEK